MLTLDRPRTTYIGGSDAAAVCGLCPYRSPVDVWLEKTGRSAPKDLSENEAVQWGNILEPVIRDQYELETGYTVSPGEFVVSDRIPWLCANVDGYAQPFDGSSRVLEIKTAGSRQAHLWGEPGTDAVPQQYVVQVMHYLAVTELSSADLAVLVGGQRFRIYHVPRDEALIDWLLEREAAFWECVTNDTPPEDRRIGDAAKLFPKSFGQSVVASSAIHQAVTDLRAIDFTIKQLETKKDGFIDSIQTYMREAAELTDAQGEVLATWKSFETTRVDQSALAKDHPEVFASCRRTTSYRRFNLKRKEDQ